MKRFNVLDSWRGIAACMVALYHLLANSHIDDLPLKAHSYLFVDFFFVLSGFVIAANYQRRLLDGFGFWRFVLLRFGRLYPLHLFILAVFLGLKAIQAQVPLLASVARNQPFGARDSPLAIVANVLLVHSMGVLDYLSFNIPSWSISTEFWAYIAFGMSLVLLRNSARTLLIGVVVLAPIFLYDKVGNIDATYDYGFVRCIFGFSLGALSWAVFDSVKGRRLGTVVEVATVACVVYFVSAAGKTGITLILPFVFAATVLVFACESGKISAMLSKPVFLRIGELSYSIYMVHFLVAGRFTDVARLLQHFGFHTIVWTRDRPLIGLERWQGDLLTIVYLAVVFVASAVTFRFVEEPSRRWFRSLAAKRAQSGKRQPELSTKRSSFPMGTLQTLKRLKRSIKSLTQSKEEHRHALVGSPHLWQMKRAFQMQFLRTMNLQPEHYLLDLGCGTLRGGIPLINYLDEGHYTGVEVREEPLNEGRRELQDAGLEGKKPILILAPDISKLKIDRKFEFIWAFSVLFHMNDKILNDTLEFVSRHLSEHGLFCANVSIGNAVEDSWDGFPVVTRSMEVYRQACARCGLKVSDLGTLLEHGHVSNIESEDGQRILRISRG